MHRPAKRVAAAWMVYGAMATGALMALAPLLLCKRRQPSAGVVAIGSEEELQVRCKLTLTARLLHTDPPTLNSGINAHPLRLASCTREAA
jgi:hypothetical protein